MKLRRMRFQKKALWGVGIFLLALLGYFYIGPNPKSRPMVWGVTFSPPYAEQLGLYWPDVYRAILEDLQVKNLRLVAYWDAIEPIPEQYDFRALDYELQEAANRGARVILVVGRRVPRWPECHVPAWAARLAPAEQDQALLKYLPAVINRYRNNPTVIMWQVENEFFLRHFGECPPAPSQLLDQELQLVRSLDRRPIVVTDSGELGGWWGALRRGDVFGTTIYRIVYNKWFGYVTYPLDPVYYLRRFLLYRPSVRAKKIINVELQAEPWAQTTLTQDSLSLQYQSFNLVQFQKNLDYARASGISPAYLWGVEWWYYMDTVQHVPQFWEMAKTLWAVPNK